MRALILLLALVSQVASAEVAIESVIDQGPLSIPASSPGRDGGWSGEVFGKLFWTFGDTFLMSPGEDGIHLRSSTGAWSPKGDGFDRTLTEPLTPAGIPHQLVPLTPAENAENLADPLNGWANWGGPVLFQRGKEAFFLFTRMRREDASGFHGRGVGIARIREGSTQATRDPELLFGEHEPNFGNGAAIVHAGFVYLYQCDVTGFLNMTCKLARAPMETAEHRASYRFFDGAGWSEDITKAATVAEYAAAGFSVAWNRHLGKFLAVQSELLANRIGLRTAPAPEGPWSEPTWIEADGAGVLPALEAVNYLALQHPGLERENGSDLFVTYSRPLGGFGFEVRAARVRLK